MTQTRRNALALTGIGLAALVVNPAAASDGMHQPSEVEAMFAQWHALHDTRSDTAEKADRVFAAYRDIQDRIIKATATSPRDVALQYLTDTEMLASCMSDEFESRLKTLAGIVT